MAQTIEFDGKRYGHQQFWALFRELMNRGFFVKIVGNKRDDGQLAYGCKLTNWKMKLEPIQTVPCTTPWVALVAAITAMELQMARRDMYR